MRFLIIVTFLIAPVNLFASDFEKKEFINNIDLLSNDYEEYKGHRLSWSDERKIRDECSQINLKTELYRNCINSFKKLAIIFKIDSKICEDKANRLSKAHKKRLLVVVDEEGIERKFLVKEGLFSKELEYEECMELMKWKDSTNFRYGRID